MVNKIAWQDAIEKVSTAKLRVLLHDRITSKIRKNRIYAELVRRQHAQR